MDQKQPKFFIQGICYESLVWKRVKSTRKEYNTYPTHKLELEYK